MRVVDFADADFVKQWYAIDDRVMGGVSRSGLASTPDQTAVFAGEVRFDHGGGFASVRGPVGTYGDAMDGSTALILRVRGDGKRYTLNVRTDPGFDSPAYQAVFAPPKDAWDELRIPFERFEARFRGRAVTDAPRLDPAGICSFGLLIAERQKGPFRLEIAWIAAER